ncbi:MAG: retroviral-like aspartic protease family protein [Gemmatimonadaceae bacterium]
MSDMGVFRVTIEIENPLRRGDRRSVPEALVDTGAELTMVPRAVLESLGIRIEKRLRLRTADGRVAQRDIGYALVRALGVETIDEVVFGDKGDMVLLGSRSLEGMNLRVDPREKKLVDAGPIAAASA